MNIAEKHTSEEIALQNFLLDINCLDELLPWSGKFNLFDVLKISRTEIRHSNMLAWLLNANENHGMGDFYLRSIIHRIVEANASKYYDTFKVLLLDLFSFTVYREWNNIDLLLVSEKEKTLFAIENKVDSKEHSDQLKRYHTTLATKFPDYQQICIYLTPTGETPSDIDNWGILSYFDIVEALENAIDRFELSSDIALMIKNYIDVIRRDIVDDQKLIEICNKIYSKHQKALDLIFEHRIDGRSKIGSVLRTVLEDFAMDGHIIYEDSYGSDTSPVFRTPKMDSILPLLPENISSWKSTNTYSYWFSFDANSLKAVFELGGFNVPAEQFSAMTELIKIAKPNDKKTESFKYKRLISRRYNIKEDADENDITQIVRTAVNDLLHWETDLLSKIDKK